LSTKNSATVRSGTDIVRIGTATDPDASKKSNAAEPAISTMNAANQRSDSRGPATTSAQIGPSSASSATPDDARKLPIDHSTANGISRNNDSCANR
jgi:hypothetical protein